MIHSDYTIQKASPERVQLLSTWITSGCVRLHDPKKRHHHHHHHHIVVAVIIIILYNPVDVIFSCSSSFSPRNSQLRSIVYCPPQINKPLGCLIGGVPFSCKMPSQFCGTPSKINQIGLHPTRQSTTAKIQIISIWL